MNKDEKRAVLNALLRKEISKKEARELLASTIKDRIFKRVTNSSGEKINLECGNYSLVEAMDKAKIEYIFINRTIISR